MHFSLFWQKWLFLATKVPSLLYSRTKFSWLLLLLFLWLWLNRAVLCDGYSDGPELHSWLLLCASTPGRSPKSPRLRSSSFQPAARSCGTEAGQVCWSTCDCEAATSPCQLSQYRNAADHCSLRKQHTLAALQQQQQEGLAVASIARDVVV